MGRSVLSNSGAERVDSGVREVAKFVGDEGARMLSILHLPEPGPARAALTLAPSLLSDRIRTYRAEVEIARELAAKGIAVQRFDYRGFGHSDDYQATAGSMLDDMRTAMTNVSEATGPVPQFAMGIAWGALIAAEASPEDGLVMWEPPTSGKAYVRQAFRAHKIASMGSGEPPQETASGTEVLGFDLADSFVESANDLSLSEARPPSSVMWLTTGSKLASPAQKIVDAWSSSGASIEIVTMGTDESWWFIQAGQMRGRHLIDVTKTWVETKVGG